VDWFFCLLKTGPMARYLLIPFWIALLQPYLSAQPTGKAVKALERHALKAPAGLEQDLPALTDYLIRPAQNDRERAWVLYCWITHYISYDLKAPGMERGRAYQSIADILRRKQGICMDFASLFKAMAVRAGMECEIVSGYSKSPPDSKPVLDEPDHAWNAVLLDGEWGLIDATWGASARDRSGDPSRPFDAEYFLADPAEFIFTHLPADPMWQLLDCPVNPGQFKLPPDSIRVVVENNAPCFNYLDSIRQFRSLPPAEKRLREMINAFGFNPSAGNERQMGHAYFDYAVALADSAEEFRNSPAFDLDSLIAIQDKVIMFGRKASTHTSLFDWQQDLFANAMINQAVALYQQAGEWTAGTSAQKNYRSAAVLLDEAAQMLASLPETPYRSHVLEQCIEYRKIVEEELERN
jgi:hypothetical protein